MYIITRNINQILFQEVSALGFTALYTDNHIILRTNPPSCIVKIGVTYRDNSVFWCHIILQSGYRIFLEVEDQVPVYQTLHSLDRSDIKSLAKEVLKKTMLQAVDNLFNLYVIGYKVDIINQRLLQLRAFKLAYKKVFDTW